MHRLLCDDALTAVMSCVALQLEVPRCPSARLFEQQSMLLQGGAWYSVACHVAPHMHTEQRTTVLHSKIGLRLCCPQARH